MKYFGRMITKLLLNNQFIEDSEKHEIQKEFDESFEKQKKNPNKLVKKMNDFFSHPFGVLGAILMYTFAEKTIQDLQRRSNEDAFEQEFELEYKKRMFEKMLKD